MPIDVATGNLRLHYQDALVFGAVEMPWDRSYGSHLSTKSVGLFGPGWTSRYEAMLVRRPDVFEFVTSAGGHEFFPDPDNAVEDGETVRNLGGFLEVFTRRGDYVVQSWSAEAEAVWRFRFRRGRPGETMVLAAIEDAAGAGLDLVHEDGRLVSVRQRREHRLLRLTYLPTGRLGAVHLEDRSGRRHSMVSYEYDADQRLCAVVDAVGAADRFEYDVNGRLCRELSKDGGVFSYRYDDRGRCVLKRGLDGYDEKRLRFIEGARCTEVTDSYGSRRTYQYLATGQIVSETDARGGQRRTTYDQHGRITSETTPGGSETRYTYDERGNRTSVTAANGGTTTFTFTDDHLVTSVTNAMGHTWRREYDGSNRLVSFTDPLNHSWRVLYNERGEPVSVTNPLDAVKRFTFENGEPVTVTDWQGVPSRTVFDAFGRIAERQVDGRRRAYRYDHAGNVTEMLINGSAIVRAQYDAAGNLTRLMDGTGRSTIFRYGPCRRLLERVDRLGASMRYRWGTEPGRLDEITNEKGERYTFVRDELGRVVRERSFDGAERHATYDADGYVVEYTNANGQRVAIARNGLHRPTRLRGSGVETDYEFDANGNLISAINQDATVVFERDPMGRIVREVCGSSWVESRYDPLGRLIQTSTSLGHVARFDVDGNGSVTTLTTHGDVRTEFLRDAHGQETARQMPGASLEQRFDTIGRLIEQNVVPAHAFGRSAAAQPMGFSRDLVHRNYAYDQNGSVISVVDRQWGRVDYAYDPGERLLQATREQGGIERFAYDSAGNVSTMHIDGGSRSAESFEYLPGNRLGRKGATVYEYDAEGRRIRMRRDTDAGPAVWTYEWDAQDRLIAFTRPDGQHWTYKYDALGRRITKTNGRSSQSYIWDKDVVVHERSGEGVSSTWMFDATSFAPVATIQNGQLYSIVCDHLGTPKELISTSGVVALSTTLGTWGGRGSTRGAEAQTLSCPLRFQGQWCDDESGLFYNRFRYYDPDTASFVSQDPLRVNAGLNLYAYAVNPANFVDPSGLCAAGDLPQLKGKSEDEVRQILADHGFTQTHVSNSPGRNETWSHPDGSEVRIHPYGNQNQAPFRSANNAHVHKESPSGQQLTDRGIPSTNPAETHIGIRNPPDLPAVRGRPHGAGTM